jgi:hypothetical protein
MTFGADSLRSGNSTDAIKGSGSGIVPMTGVMSGCGGAGHGDGGGTGAGRDAGSGVGDDIDDEGPICRTAGTALRGSAFASSARAVMSSWTSLRISLTASSGANTSPEPVKARIADSDVIPALLRRTVGSVFAVDSPRAACT